VHDDSQGFSTDERKPLHEKRLVDFGGIGILGKRKPQLIRLG